MKRGEWADLYAKTQLIGGGIAAMLLMLLALLSFCSKVD